MMRRTLPSLLAGAAAALISISVVMAAVGDLVATVSLPASGSDVGIAFDGTRIYYNDVAGTNQLVSFEPGNPAGTMTSVTVMAGLTPIDLDAMAYDGTRDLLWAVRHATNEVYTVNKLTGAATLVFDATGKCLRCVGSYKDGLAFDAGNPADPLDDAIWWSYDVDWGVYKLDLTGGVIEFFDVRGPDGIGGTADDIDSSLLCGSSGIAVGGPNLYLGTNGCGTIVRVDKATKAFVDVLASPGSRPEDLECDPVTYAPTEVMWVRQYEDPDNVRAFEIEPETCGLGGGDPEPEPVTGRFTGGGSVFMGGGMRVTHGLTLHCDVSLPNNLQVNWGGNRFHLESLTTAACSDDPAIEPKPPAAGFDTFKGSGSGRYNGVSGATIEFTLTDAGEPGRDDSATITIMDASSVVVLSVSGKLDRGNQQAHDE